MNIMNIMTKYGLYILLLFAGISQVNAQTFKSFKVDWGLGYAFGGSSSFTTDPLPLVGEIETTTTGLLGLMFFLEPRYGISDNLTVGLRYGAYLLGGGSSEVSLLGQTAPVDDGLVTISGVASVLATADYYFSTNSVRPFGGLGVGIYSSETVGLDTDNLDLDGTSVSGLGVMPRFGVNFGHFKTILSYNLPFAEGVPKYLTFSIGIEFGGGRKG